MYFQRHRSTFSNYHSPMAHFHSHKSDTTSIKQHFDWIDSLRQGMWDQVTFKDQLIPSNEALYRHYLRSSWVINYWCKGSNNNMQLLPVISFGWKLNKEVLQIEWDSDENIQTIKEHVTFLNRYVPLEYAHAEKLEGHVDQAVAVLAVPTYQHKVRTVKFILLALSQTSTQYSTHS